MREIVIASSEQTIALADGYRAEIRYNPFDRFWFYNLIGPDGEYAAYGLALIVNSCPLLKTTYPKLALVDRLYGDKTEYNPFEELGSRLMLIEL